MLFGFQFSPILHAHNATFPAFSPFITFLYNFFSTYLPFNQSKQIEWPRIWSQRLRPFFSIWVDSPNFILAMCCIYITQFSWGEHVILHFMSKFRVLYYLYAFTCMCFLFPCFISLKDKWNDYITFRNQRIVRTEGSEILSAAVVVVDDFGFCDDTI